MFSRKNLRKILKRHQKESQKLYFKKLKTAENSIQKFSNETNNINNNDNDNKYGYGYVYDYETDLASFENYMNLEKSEEVTTHCLQLNERNSSPLRRDKNVNNDYANLDTFHRAARPIFLLAQCFAVMPIMGVGSKSPHHMHFSYASTQMLVTILFLLSNGLLFTTMLKHLTDLGINAKNFVGLAFFSCAEIACFLFLLLARRWPKLIQNWTRVEMIFTQSPYEEPKNNLRKRVRFAAFTLLILAIIEHALSLLSAILSYLRKVQICGQENHSLKEFSFDEYITKTYNYVFSLLPYNTAVGIFILISNAMSTFIWNYMDIFIMIISKGIAYRFEQIMMRINKIANQEVPEKIFIEIRTHYVMVCELLDNVDEHLSEIILLSCMNNLYFVCYQLLNIFNKLRWPINHIYFWYSLLYLIGRTAFVFLTAASINDQSKSALTALRSISHKTWCVEVERLIFQMTTQTVALSGKKFYFMTRRLLFGMAGTIVTYELVLLQFDEPNRSQGLPPLCE